MGLRLQTPVRPASSVALRLEELAEAVLGRPLPVRLRAWDGSSAGPVDAPSVAVRSPRALRRLLWQPNELGLAQAYVTGELDVDGELAAGLRQVRAALTAQPAERARLGPRRWAAALAAAARLGAIGLPLAPPASQAKRGWRATLTDRLTRDRAAIAHHYDLSNEFYALILDPSMAYSCAYWTSDHPSYGLADAQRDKLDLVCRKLELQPGMRLLDMGCGWGSLTLHAARYYDVSVLAVTLSAQQHAYVQRRVDETGLAGSVQVRLAHYRELAAGQPDGSFDAIASIEMGEHVGRDHYGEFARALHRLLRPGGRLLVQQMSRGDNWPGGGPFIESFIAPGMHMRPVGQTVDLLEGAGLELRSVEALREHYVRTVAAWYDTFERHWAQVVDLVGLEVARVWRLYLVGGGLAFEEGRMGVDQILAVRPGG